VKSEKRATMMGNLSDKELDESPDSSSSSQAIGFSATFELLFRALYFALK
jgi:hypothetical protein